MSRLKKGGAIAALCVALVGGFEGLRTYAYLDSVHVPTICYGETLNVRMGMKAAKAECDATLIRRLDQFANGVEACVKAPMTDKTEVAFISLAYNIGIAGFCQSSVVRLYNDGQRLGACNAMLKFNRAGGRVLAGLSNRRAVERDLCVKGL